MNIRKLTADWEDDWDQFCRDNSDAWFWHTTDWLDYYLSYTADQDGRSLSFLVTYAKEIQGICPLVLTDDGARHELSFGGGYGPRPVVADETRGINPETVEQKLFDEVDRLAREHDVDRVGFATEPLSPGQRSTTRSHNPFRSHGYLDTTVNTRLVELDQSEEVLWDDMRDSYRDEIEATAPAVSVQVYDGSTVTREIFDAYQALHRKDAGRQTRPQRTFDLMYEWIRDENAFLVGATTADSFAEFAYFTTYKDGVYYSSAASDPDITDISSGHYVQWTALQWMHDQGYRFCDLGDQHYTPQIVSPSTAKERDISFYKRGFGGFDVPRFRGEKFYDAEYFEETYRRRLGDCVREFKTR